MPQIYNWHTRDRKWTYNYVDISGSCHPLNSPYLPQMPKSEPINIAGWCSTMSCKCTACILLVQVYIYIYMIFFYVSYEC